MKKLAKRTAAAALAGVLAAGMLAGCGEEKKLDGTKTVATVDGTEIPLGVVSLMARQQQAYTEAMYANFGMATGNIWDTEADSETGETYGDQAVSNSLEQVELMYIMKTKAADYGVEVTEEDQKAIEEAAAQFMEDNSEEVIAELAVTEDHVKTFLELETYQTRMYDPIVADADTEVSDEEAQKSSFTYVRVSTSSTDDEEELTEEELAEKKDLAQQVLDAVKEDPEAGMSETAKSVDESLSALSGTFTTNVSEDEEEEESSSGYPDEVLEALRGLKDGEVYDEVIETAENGYYVVRLDKVFDEDATETERESIISQKEQDFYTETTDQWLADAEITVEEKVLKTLKITDSHSFTYAAEEVSEDEVQTEEEIDAEAAEENAEDAEVIDEDADDADLAETEDTEEEVEAEEVDAEEEDADDMEAEVTPTEKAEPTATTAPTPTEKADK